MGCSGPLYRRHHVHFEAGTLKIGRGMNAEQVVRNDLDLIVRYESANVSNTNLAYQENVNVMKALVSKYPELRDAFAAVVARAVDTSGRDYGTLLAMKDIK